MQGRGTAVFAQPRRVKGERAERVLGREPLGDRDGVRAQRMEIGGFHQYLGQKVRREQQRLLRPPLAENDVRPGWGTRRARTARY